MNIYDLYNLIAGQNGWLPIGINVSSDAETIYDASQRCRGCFPELADQLLSATMKP